MTRVYLVTDSFAEGSTPKAYTTRDKAEYAIKLMGGDLIEEVELDWLPQHPDGHLWWLVNLKEDGTIKSMGNPGLEIAAADTPQGRIEYGMTDSYPPLVWMRFWATDREYALEVAAARRDELIESGEWREMFDEVYREFDGRLSSLRRAWLEELRRGSA